MLDNCELLRGCSNLLTVYGFPLANTNLVLPEFEKYSVISKHVPGLTDNQEVPLLPSQVNGFQNHRFYIWHLGLQTPTRFLLSCYNQMHGVIQIYN